MFDSSEEAVPVTVTKKIVHGDSDKEDDGDDDEDSGRKMIKRKKST